AFAGQLLLALAGKLGTLGAGHAQTDTVGLAGDLPGCAEEVLHGLLCEPVVTGAEDAAQGCGVGAVRRVENGWVHCRACGSPGLERVAVRKWCRPHSG